MRGFVGWERSEPRDVFFLPVKQSWEVTDVMRTSGVGVQEEEFHPKICPHRGGFRVVCLLVESRCVEK